MNLRTWLSLAIAGLFQVQAPVCAIACATDGDVIGAVAGVDLGSEHAPCHGGGETAPHRDADPEPREHDCGCDRLESAPLKTGAAGTPGQTRMPVATATRTEVPVPPASIPAAHLGPLPRGLPPPDILLLKASFLL